MWVVFFGLRGPQTWVLAPIRQGMRNDLSMLNDLSLAVVHRRLAQDKRHGGPEHDDTHTRAEWVALIIEHAQASMSTESLETFEHEMVDVAALALAGVASAKRKARRELLSAELLGPEKWFVEKDPADGFFATVTRRIVAELEKGSPTRAELAAWLADSDEIEKRLAGTELESVLPIGTVQRDAVLAKLSLVASMLPEFVGTRAQ